jgi:hypothetical protein
MSWLISLVTGPVLNAITGPLLDAYRAKLAAANTSDKLAVDLAIKEVEAEIAARQDARAIIIAEQGRWYTAMVRPLIVLPFGVYIWKVVIWDIVLGWGVTDPIRGDVASLMMVVIGSYFSGRTIEKVVQSFKRR